VLTLGAVAAAVLALGFSFLFVPLVSEPTALLWWAGFWLVVTYAAYSALSVAHQSWGAMLGGDAAYRSRVVAWREGLGLFGVLLAAVTPALLGIPAMLALLFVSLVGGWWAWNGAPRPERRVDVKTGTVSTVPDALWHPWRNPDFRRLLGVYLLNGVASAVLALAAGLALPLLGWFGYSPGARGAEAAALLTAAYCLLPCGLKALAATALHVFIIQPTAQPRTP
jgi:GPH family glycoside/pentoside/hexuronide:cation symporter